MKSLKCDEFIPLLRSHSDLGYELHFTFVLVGGLETHKGKPNVCKKGVKNMLNKTWIFFKKNQMCTKRNWENVEDRKTCTR